MTILKDKLYVRMHKQKPETNDNLRSVPFLLFRLFYFQQQNWTCSNPSARCQHEGRHCSTSASICQTPPLQKVADFLQTVYNKSIDSNRKSIAFFMGLRDGTTSWNAEGLETNRTFRPQQAQFWGTPYAYEQDSDNSSKWKFWFSYTRFLSDHVQFRSHRNSVCDVKRPTEKKSS